MSSTAIKILAIFFPPIAVLIRFGFGGKFLLNILLTIIGWLPGVVHAFYILSKAGEPTDLSTTQTHY